MLTLRLADTAFWLSRADFTSPGIVTIIVVEKESVALVYGPLIYNIIMKCKYKLTISYLNAYCTVIEQR